MTEGSALWFDFYGLRVAVEADDGGLLEDIARDFSYFRAGGGGAAGLGITLRAGPGPRERLPGLRATLQTPRNMVYRDAAASYIDYAGRP